LAATFELHKALFMVDDAAERAIRAGASQSYEGVQATLSKLDDALVAVAKLNADARRMMANDVVARGGS